MTKKEHLAALRPYTQRIDLLERALQDAATGATPDGAESWHEADAPSLRYTMAAFRSDGPTGGYLLTTFRAHCQAPSVDVFTLDDTLRAWQANMVLPLPCRIAAERLMTKIASVRDAA
jgi:hypothetical protein